MQPTNLTTMRFLIIMLMLTTYIAKAQTIPCFTFDEGEFVVSGNATIINDDTVRLTQAINNQAGFVWSQSLVNFDLDFSLEAELYLGTQNGGADGIAFVIQAISNNEGSLGEVLGTRGFHLHWPLNLILGGTLEMTLHKTIM